MKVYPKKCIVTSRLGCVHWVTYLAHAVGALREYRVDPTRRMKWGINWNQILVQPIFEENTGEGGA